MAATTLPAALVSRPATLTDAEAITEPMNICSIAKVGHPTAEISEALTDWASPHCHPATNTCLVLDGERVIDYAGVWIEPPPASLYSWAHVQPD